MTQEPKQDINRYKVKFLNQNQKYKIRKHIVSRGCLLASYISYALWWIIPESIRSIKSPIFIIGCSRSGTTLFRDMFKEHEDIANWSEAAHVLELRYYDPEIDHFKGEKDATLFDQRRLRVLFGLSTRLRRKSRFLNKHPQNSLRIGFIKSIFPDAKFIHLIRDGAATAYSNYAQVLRDQYRQRVSFGYFPKPEAWRTYTDLPLIEQFAHQWVDVITHIRSTISSMGFGRDYIEVRYEEFCHDPHGILRTVDKFCELSPVKRNYERIPTSFEARNGKWKNMLCTGDKRSVEAIIGPLNSELGYDRHLEGPPREK